MIRFLMYAVILVSPFLFMILINESVRDNNKKDRFVYKGVVAMNTNKVLADKCTWHCQTSTRYCEQHHVKYLNPYLDKTNPFYYGMIKQLSSYGNYSAANIFFLVVLWPLLMYLLVLKNMQLRLKIKNIKK